MPRGDDVSGALTKLLRDVVAEHERELARAREASPPVRLPNNEFCGARTRRGTPCKRKDIYASGRCKLHGGLSTGPRTLEGKRKSALNGLKPKRPRERTS